MPGKSEMVQGSVWLRVWKLDGECEGYLNLIEFL